MYVESLTVFCNRMSPYGFFRQFSGNAVQTLKCNDPIKIITVRGTAFEAAPVSGGSGSTEEGM